MTDIAPTALAFDLAAPVRREPPPRMALQSAPEAELRRRAATDDQAAFGELMRRHKDRLYSFAWRLTGDRQDAYDMLQEAFVSAWAARARHDPERPFEPWLRRIVLNKCRDHLRRRRRRRVWGPLRDEPGLEVRDPAPAADLLAARHQALARLAAAIEALPTGLREPLVLVALEDLSYGEAGEILGMNAKAVDSRVYRARKQLAAALARSDLEDILG